MENREQFDDILTRSLTQELTGDEKTFLAAWLAASEDNRQYYDALKNTWQLMAVKQTADNINVEQEWAHFQQSVGNTPGKKTGIYKLIISTAVAASVLVAIGLGWNWWGNKKTIQAPAVSTAGKKDSVPYLARHEMNTSGKPKQLVLQDGSEIWLDPGSVLSWQEPFSSSRRDMMLAGRANFKVAKDKTRPFTVYSGDISTTVLGTVFTVTAFPREDNITVRLYEGKVVVKSADSMHPKLKNDIYLLPGQELLYDNNRNTAKVRRFTTGNANLSYDTMNDRKRMDNPSLPAGEKGSWYMFNNQSLAQVFNQLKTMYGVYIEYSEKDIQKMYFIGKFSKNDSIGTILHQIAALNNLTVTRKDNKFIISR